jgi:hypothetical protein
LGEIVRGSQICNFLEKIRPPAATEIKTNRAAVRGKNPENLQILKLQYLDLPDSVSDDFFFQIGCFSEMNSDIQPVSTNFAHKYTKKLWNVSALFFLLRKKICKNKKYLPTMFVKESALIPLVKNLNRSTNIITTNTEYTIDLQSKIEETTLYYYQTLEVEQHRTMDPIMEGIISCSLASSRGHPPIELPLQIQYFSSCLITLLEPLYIVLPSPKNILEGESSRSRTF